MMQMITSSQNKTVKEWKKLHQKKYRTQNESFIIEGFHLIEEVFKSDWTIKQLILREDTKLPDMLEAVSYERVTEAVFNEISETETPQGIAAVVQVKKMELLHEGPQLLIDRVQDPGNLGTIIRTAAALGFSQTVIGKGTVDIYNPKVIRATQGSLFHMNLVEAALEDVIEELSKEGYMIAASTLHHAKPLDEVAYSSKTALIVGNEGAGISEEIIELADTRITIPITSQAESLNVGIAAGIMMYEITKSHQ